MTVFHIWIIKSIFSLSLCFFASVGGNLVPVLPLKATVTQTQNISRSLTVTTKTGFDQISPERPTLWWRNGPGFCSFGLGCSCRRTPTWARPAGPCGSRHPSCTDGPESKTKHGSEFRLKSGSSANGEDYSFIDHVKITMKHLFILTFQKSNGGGASTCLCFLWILNLEKACWLQRLTAAPAPTFSLSFRRVAGEGAWPVNMHAFVS